MSNAGRPTKINEAMIDQIAEAVRRGNYMETAAAYAGISKPTLYDWLKRGAKEKQRVESNTKNRIRESERLFVEFSNAIKTALADAEMRDVGVITNAATVEGVWQASAWRLERKFPDRWGRKKLELSGPDNGPIQHEVEVVGEETKEQQFERLFAAIDQYRADVDVSDSGVDPAESMDTDVPNGKAT